MDPSTMIWGSKRLAPLQVCLWGHPQPLASHMDYFVSSDAFHRDVEAHSASDVTVTFVSESSDVQLPLQAWATCIQI